MRAMEVESSIAASSLTALIRDRPLSMSDECVFLCDLDSTSSLELLDRMERSSLVDMAARNEELIGFGPKGSERKLLNLVLDERATGS